jgi:hypothetical protein
MAKEAPGRLLGVGHLSKARARRNGYHGALGTPHALEGLRWGRTTILVGHLPLTAALHEFRREVGGLHKISHGGAESTVKVSTSTVIADYELDFCGTAIRYCVAKQIARYSNGRPREVHMNKLIVPAVIVAICAASSDAWSQAASPRLNRRVGNRS